MPRLLAMLLAALSACSAMPSRAMCPFCDPGEATLTEEINACDAAVIARLVKAAEPIDYGPDEFGEFGVVDPDAGKATFAIVDVLRGEDILVGIDEFNAVFFGEPKDEELYLVTAIAEPLDWAVPLPVSNVAADYIRALDDVPAGGPARVEYFLGFLQHEDPLLALDAYEEFARAPYADVVALRDELDRQQLKIWIEDPWVSPNRRSLYFTLLGVCGGPDDIPWLERMMLADRRSLVAGTEVGSIAALATGGGYGLVAAGEAVAMEENRKKLGFSALVGCYLTLHGEAGLEVVDKYFLADPTADYSQVYAAVQAIRISGEETERFELDRLKQSMRLVLSNPDFAEQAITDLARWEDWSIVDRLIEMFREPDQYRWTRETIVAYLDIAAEQEGEVGEKAAAALVEFEQLDPKAVKNARVLAGFGFLGGARGGPIADGKSIPPNAVRPTDPDGKGDDSPEMTIESAVDTIMAADDSAPDTARDDIAEDVGTPSADVADAGDESLMTEEPPAEAVTTTDAEQPNAIANSKQPQSPAGAVTAADAERYEEPSRALLVGVPLFSAAAFMALFYVILRGGI